jgi:hypothetical protein
MFSVAVTVREPQAEFPHSFFVSEATHRNAYDAALEGESWLFRIVPLDSESLDFVQFSIVECSGPEADTVHFAEGSVDEVADANEDAVFTA